jgi:4-oxalocrotonate tautomerase
MPYINLKVAGPLSAEQKKEIAKQFTQTLKEVAGKNPSSTYLVFEEVDRGNWAVGEKLLSEK